MHRNILKQKGNKSKKNTKEKSWKNTIDSLPKICYNGNVM